MRRDEKKFLLVMDGYSAHISYNTLVMIRDHNITVCGLPAHTSHVLQPLDICVFDPVNEKFTRLLNRRTVTTSRNDKNDIFTICELLCLAYQKYVTPAISVGYFKISGLWNLSEGGCGPSQIRAEDFTLSTVKTTCFVGLNITRNTRSIFEFSTTQSTRLVEKQLVEFFKQQSQELYSDVTVVEAGTIKVTTTTGATLRGDNVISALKERDEKRASKREQRVNSQLLRGQRSYERGKAQTEANTRIVEREKNALEREELDLVKMR